MDEAYHHFVADKAYETMATRAARDRRLVVTRTFSKIYGMAGLRVGYAVGHKDTSKLLRIHMTSAYIPVTSTAAALAALRRRGGDQAAGWLNNQTRALTVQFFEGLGYEVAPSETNFVMVAIKRDAGRSRRPARPRRFGGAAVRRSGSTRESRWERPRRCRRRWRCSGRC